MNWQTKEGEQIPVHQITDVHLINIVRLKMRVELVGAPSIRYWMRFARMQEINWYLLMQLKLRDLTGQFDYLSDYFADLEDRALTLALTAGESVVRRGEIGQSE